MLVYLLRHGIAEDHHPGGDAARELTAEGSAKLQRAGPAWRRVAASPTRVYTSPLRRAVQTAELFALATCYTGTIATERMLAPDEDPRDALALLLGERKQDTPSIALVGHEPHLGTLLGLLLTGSKHAAVPLKKGMLVALELRSSASAIAELRFALSQRAAGELGETK